MRPCINAPDDDPVPCEAQRPHLICLDLYEVARGAGGYRRVRLAHIYIWLLLEEHLRN